MCGRGEREDMMDMLYILCIHFHRPDRTMQDIVYKLVPGLYKSKSHVCYHHKVQST